MARTKKSAEVAPAVTPAVTATTPKNIRAWLVANGHPVGQRGRISQAQRDLFDAA